MQYASHLPNCKPSLSHAKLHRQSPAISKGNLPKPDILIIIITFVSGRLSRSLALAAAAYLPSSWNLGRAACCASVEVTVGHCKKPWGPHRKQSTNAGGGSTCEWWKMAKRMICLLHAFGPQLLDFPESIEIKKLKQMVLIKRKKCYHMLFFTDRSWEPLRGRAHKGMRSWTASALSHGDSRALPLNSGVASRIVRTLPLDSGKCSGQMIHLQFINIVSIIIICINSDTLLTCKEGNATFWKSEFLAKNKKIKIAFQDWSRYKEFPRVHEVGHSKKNAAHVGLLSASWRWQHLCEKWKGQRWDSRCLRCWKRIQNIWNITSFITERLRTILWLPILFSKMIINEQKCMVAHGCC